MVMKQLLNNYNSSIRQLDDGSALVLPFFFRQGTSHWVCARLSYVSAPNDWYERIESLHKNK